MVITAVRIPIGAHLAAEELQRFIVQCHRRQQTPEDRILELIRKEIAELPTDSTLPNRQKPGPMPGKD